MARIYIAFYSRTGEVEQMAQGLAEGVTWQGGEPVVAYIPPAPDQQEAAAADPEWANNDQYCRDKYPLADPAELVAADGAAFGTSSVLGAVSTEMKKFIETIFETQQIGGLFNKPASTFTAASKGEPGHELANYTMWLPLSLLGYVLVGVTHQVPGLPQTYDESQSLGAFHGVVDSAAIGLSRSEWTTTHVLGGRLAVLAEACQGVSGLDVFQRARTPEDDRLGLPDEA
jgi:NAD(P)H dehydrogenase (quinone)